MALKIFCDSKDCDKELNDLDFVFEGTIMEMRDSFDLGNPNAGAKKQMMKRQIHFCRDCFKKHLMEEIK